MQDGRAQYAARGVRRIAIPLPIPALKIVNVYLVEGDDRSLVDTGIHTPEAEAALREGLAAAGVKMAEIARVFVTHLHPDHYGMAGTLEREGASVVMHRPEAQRAREVWHHDGRLIDATYRWFALHGMPGEVNDGMRHAWKDLRSRVDRPRVVSLVDDGATFDLGGRNVRVTWTPGHTDFHAVLFDEETGTLFSGDHVLPRISSNVGLYSFSRDDPLGDFLGSLRRVRALPVRRVLPAHGEPFDDLGARVDELLDHHRARLENVVECATGVPAYTIAKRLFPQLRSPHEERFALAETLAHLRHLERTEKVVPTETAPVLWIRV